MKKNLTTVFVSLGLILCTGVIYAQNKVNMGLHNISCSSNQIEFDLMITNNSNESIKLSACSFGINLNNALINHGALTFEVLPDLQQQGLGKVSSQVKNAKEFSQARVTTIPLGKENAIELRSNVPFKVGRFILKNSATFLFNEASNIQLQEQPLIGFTATQLVAYVNGKSKVLALTAKSNSIKTVVEEATCITKPNVANCQNIKHSANTSLKGSILLTEDIRIYPNPVSDKLKLNMYAKVKGELKVSIIDMQGRIMKQTPISFVEGNNMIEVDVHELPNGAYIIELNGNAGFKYNNSFIKK